MGHRLRLRRGQLRVQDSGIGISQEFAAKMFNAIKRKRTSTVSGIEGTGLGLAITKRIMDLMGGGIEVITSPGSGTEFIIRLKRNPENAGSGCPLSRENHK